LNHYTKGTQDSYRYGKMKFQDFSSTTFLVFGTTITDLTYQTMSLLSFNF